MQIKIISNKLSSLMDSIDNFLKENFEERKIVLGAIDDSAFFMLYPFFNKKDKLFISVDKKITTQRMFEKILNRQNVLICNNNLLKNINLTNFFLVKNENKFKIMFFTCLLTKDFFSNPNSIAICLEGNEYEMAEINKLNCIIDIDSKEYFELNQSTFNELKDQMQFRNEKAISLKENFGEDEVRMSFRNFDKILQTQEKEISILEIENKQINNQDIEIEIDL